VEKLRAFVASKENPLSLVGPMLFAAAVAALWGLAKEVSPLLPAAGLIGLAFTWQGSKTSLWIAQGILVLSLAVSLWINPFDFYWQAAFALSLSLSLLITSLAQAEAIDGTVSSETTLQGLTSALEAAQQQATALQERLDDKDTFLCIARDELLHLQQQQRDWSNAVFEQKQKTARQEEALEEQVLGVIDSPEYRRLNGAYTQLKEQFKDKDLILTETRRDLFKAQESAAALSKELDEFKLYGVPSEIAQLQQHCVETEREAQEEIARLRAELKLLEQVVKEKV
jgi:hypothetical protein